MTKRFGAFTALDDVSLKVGPASVHALLGENGAGKSTLVKCLLGFYRADERQLPHRRPRGGDRQSRTMPTRLGLGMVYQHFTLVPSMTAAENLVMARADVPAVIDWGQGARAPRRLHGHACRSSVPLDVPVSGARGRRAAEGRDPEAALSRPPLAGARRADLDLTPQEAEEVLGLVRGLASAGDITVIIITHKLKEVAAFADDVTVLAARQDGRRRRRRVRCHRGDLTALMIGEAAAPAPVRRLGEADDRAASRRARLAHRRRPGPPRSRHRRARRAPARDRRRRRRLRQRPARSRRGAGRPAPAGRRFHRGRRRALRGAARGRLSPQSAAAARGAAAQRLRGRACR